MQRTAVESFFHTNLELSVIGVFALHRHLKVAVLQSGIGAALTYTDVAESPRIHNDDLQDDLHGPSIFHLVPSRVFDVIGNSVLCHRPVLLAKT